MATEKTKSGWEPFGPIDWVVSRGMMSFGPLAALLSLLFNIYRGDPPTWPEAVSQSCAWVFVAGPLWGLGMWWWFRRRFGAARHRAKAE